jgi:ribose transport system substrate-binding protein
MRKNVRFFITVVMVAVFLIGGMSPLFSADKWKGGVSLPLLNAFYLPFMRALKNSIEDAGGKAIWTEAEGYQVPKELSNVENLLAQDIDVLFIDACDQVASAPAIRAANKAGVPVVCLNAKVENVDMITYISADNYGAGKLAAQYLVKKLNGRGEILVINGPPVTAVLDRIDGLKDELNKYPRMKVVGEQIMKNTMADGLYVAENLLAAHPEADGFFTMNDYGFLGAYTALEAIGREKEVIITSVDGLADVVTLLASGDAGDSMTVAQFPIHMAKAGIQSYLDYKEGKPVNPEIKVKVEIVDQNRAAAGFHW